MDKFDHIRAAAEKQILEKGIKESIGTAHTVQFYFGSAGIKATLTIERMNDLPSSDR